MTTDAQQETKTFDFTSGNLEEGDLYFLRYDGGEIIIAVTSLEAGGRGATNIMGMATERTGKWCGPYGRIVFVKPIARGQQTDAMFNASGNNVVLLEVVPTGLDRIRGNRCDNLLD